MPTYLIEVPHSGNVAECKHVIEIFKESGSHLLTNALWGCKDGVHKSWFIYDFDNKEDALKVIPPFLRPNAQVIELTKFSTTDMPDLVKHN
jgi:hypothetical protein